MLQILQALLVAAAGAILVFGVYAYAVIRGTPEEERRHFRNPNVPYGFTHWR